MANYFIMIISELTFGRAENPFKPKFADANKTVITSRFTVSIPLTWFIIAL